MVKCVDLMKCEILLALKLKRKTCFPSILPSKEPVFTEEQGQ